MASQLDIDPQIANELMALAKARGVTVATLLREFVEQEKHVAPTRRALTEPTSEESETDMQALTEGTEGQARLWGFGLQSTSDKGVNP